MESCNISVKRVEYIWLYFDIFHTQTQTLLIYHNKTQFVKEQFTETHLLMLVDQIKNNVVRFHRATFTKVLTD